MSTTTETLPEPTRPTAYRWPDQESGLIAWLIHQPDGSLLYGWRRDERGANEAISWWCRTLGLSTTLVHNGHPNEEMHRVH